MSTRLPRIGKFRRAKFQSLEIFAACAVAAMVCGAAELKPLSVRGVNYFPRETPWSGMWTKTPDEVWEKDMAVAASLGCNTVRTFVQVSEHIERAGLVAADGALSEAYRGKLERLLTAGAKHGIRFMLCFEFSPGWLGATNAQARWRRAMGDVLARHRDDSRVLMWDLMNEPDDDKKWNANTRAYLADTLVFAKQQAPNHPTTVGLTWRVQRLAEIGLPDVMQYHEYAGRETLFERGVGYVPHTLGWMRKLSGTRPWIIGEFGMCTARDEKFGVKLEPGAKMRDSTGTEAEQERLYEMVLAGAEAANVAGVLAWCLHDYPIRNVDESHFGLVRADGSLKPAAIKLRETFARWSAKP